MIKKSKQVKITKNGWKKLEQNNSIRMMNGDDYDDREDLFIYQGVTERNRLSKRNLMGDGLKKLSKL